MPPPRAPGRPARARKRDTERRARRFAGLAVLGVVVVVTLVLTAFGSGGAPPSRAAAAPATALPAGPPRPQIVALAGGLRLYLPVSQLALTAVGYHASGNGAMPLEPIGKQGNRGLLGRLADKLFGDGSASLTWYRLPGGSGPATAGLDVGAAPGTDVYAPVDGTVIGITDLVLDRRRHGFRVDIQPSSAPSLVVSVDRVATDPALTVGATVVAARTRIGTVLELSSVERQALAAHTRDAGDHVTLEVRPAATLTP